MNGAMWSFSSCFTKQKLRVIRLLGLTLGVVSVMGCSHMPPLATKLPASPMVEAYYAATPVAVDGRLDDAIWKTAPAYQLALGADMAGKHLREPGHVQFAWDEKYLYLAAQLTDSDVVAEGDADGLHHYRMGDTCELFLKPDGQPGFWEFHVTPRGHQATFYWPSVGRELPSALQSSNRLTVAAQVQGTLNNYHDRDEGWTAEVAVPISLLTEQGDAFGPTSRWRIMVARYNYSRYLPAAELSSMPKLSRTNFHLVEEYAELRIVPPRDKQ